jgi:ribulose-5-phosphate 4-epimerase/fuculose-1-phosphate aldolase
MSGVAGQLQELVVANRVLAQERVLDGFGHVSMRHPERADRFFMSRSRAPELVALDDLMEFDLDCNPVDQRGRTMYAERPIHGAVYQARPDVHAVVHNHAYEVIPFSVTKEKLRPLLHVAGSIGRDIPVWDIRTKFGDTNMLVTTEEQGRDLAQTLGGRPVALMRGHGCVVARESLRNVVFTSIYLMVNARLQSDASKFGDITFMSEGEIKLTSEMMFKPVSIDRVWEYWTRRAGMADGK